MSENEVAIPPKAHERLRASLAQLQQLQQLQQSANSYFQGIIDSLGLEGEWSLDATRMVAVKAQVPDAAQGAGP